MKRTILLLTLITSFLVSCAAQVKIAPVRLTGKVIAYIESNIISPPHSFIPNGDVLIVEVKSSKKTERQFIKVITEYFEGESPLPKNIFSKNSRWNFKITRRIDCDSVLSPDYSGLINSANDEKDENVWIIDKAPKLNIIRSEEIQKIPVNQILPCYLILSLKEK